MAHEPPSNLRALPENPRQTLLASRVGEMLAGALRQASGGFGRLGGSERRCLVDIRVGDAHRACTAIGGSRLPARGVRGEPRTWSAQRGRVAGEESTLLSFVSRKQTRARNHGPHSTPGRPRTLALERGAPARACFSTHRRGLCRVFAAPPHPEVGPQRHRTARSPTLGSSSSPAKLKRGSSADAAFASSESALQRTASPPESELETTKIRRQLPNPRFAERQHGTSRAPQKRRERGVREDSALCDVLVEAIRLRCASDRSASVHPCPAS